MAALTTNLVAGQDGHVGFHNEERTALNGKVDRDEVAFMVPVTGDFGLNLQATLDRARGKGTVIVPPGSYNLTRTIHFGQGDTLYALGATITKVSPGPGTTANNYTGANGGVGGYGGNGDITIIGGVWDNNVSNYAAAGNGFTFDHCKNITMQYVTIRNIGTYHGIELNAVDGARILYCNLEGWKDLTTDKSAGSKEIIQIDVAGSGSPESAPYDDTHSRNLLIQGCRCTASPQLPAPPRFVGSHSRAAGLFFENISIIDNFIDGVSSNAIHGYAWRNAIIRGNFISNSGGNAIAVDQSERVTTTGNITRDTNGSGVRYTGGTTGIISDNNVLRAKIDSIGVFTGCDGVIVHDNRIADGGAYGIVVNSVNKDVTVHHNTITGNGTDGVVSSQIRVSQGPVNCKIMDNTVRKSGASVEAANALSTSSDVTGLWYSGNDCRGYGAAAFVVSAPTPITFNNQTA